MSDFVDEAPGAAARTAAVAPQSVAAEDFDEGAPTAFRASDRASNTEIIEGDYGQRVLPETTSKLIDKMFDGTEDPDEAELEAAPADPAAPAPADQAKPAEVAPAANEWQTKHAAEVATRERVEAANKQLLADLEAARAKTVETPPVHKLLNEAGNQYLEDDIAAVRKLIAAGHGIDDPMDATVTAELAALTNVLTAHVFNVPLDTAQQASRDAARARQLLARDKRERKAESEQAAQRSVQQAEVAKADAAAAYIGNQLNAKDYPLLMALSHDFDGVTPGHVAWRALEQADKLGKIDRTKMSEAELVAYGAKEVENHYRGLADKILKVTQPPPADKPSTATTPNENKSKDQRQSHGARTLTQAAASVAPATPPAVKTRTAQPTKMPSKKDILDKHFAD